MAGIQGEAVSALANQVSQPSNTSAVAGGKSGARPMYTAMGTPVVYGKSYLNNYTKDYVAPLAKTTVTDSGGDGGSTSADGMSVSANALSVDDASISEGVSAPSEGGSSDGTAGGAVGDSGDGSGSYANGTTSVPGYYNGTMGVDDDPWAWTRAQPVVAPLSAEIKPSNEQALGRMPDRTEQQLSSMLVGKGVDAATQGINTAYKAYTAAPLAAAEGATAATTGATAGATGAAMAGGEAALGAMGPVGAIIGGALLAKKLKIF
jgi:hypothetical protein